MNRDDLIAAMRATAAQPPQPVPVPGWGTVYVRPATVAEVDAASDDPEPTDGKKRRFARGAARVLCGADGARIFDPLNDADVDLLAAQPWATLQKVLAAVEGKGAPDPGNPAGAGTS
jgi:hypothetical protein